MQGLSTHSISVPAGLPGPTAPHPAGPGTDSRPRHEGRLTEGRAVPLIYVSYASSASHQFAVTLRIESMLREQSVKMETGYSTHVNVLAVPVLFDALEVALPHDCHHRGRPLRHMPQHRRHEPAGAPTQRQTPAALTIRPVHRHSHMQQQGRQQHCTGSRSRKPGTATQEERSVRYG